MTEVADSFLPELLIFLFASSIQHFKRICWLCKRLCGKFTVYIWPFVLYFLFGK